MRGEEEKTLEESMSSGPYSASTTSLVSLIEPFERHTILDILNSKWRKMLRRDFAEITRVDPSYKVIYLGNVVTCWAKGEGCLERPASALWRNHTQGRGSIKMTVTVAPSGLKAHTREHGLTEYWANRLTWCGVSPDYPRLFCWIYRHEGRKLKQELRCHAVLCSKEERAKCLATTLKNRLSEALYDFRKEKFLRQNARLSITSSLFNPGPAKRRFLLINSNSQNYKPPLERSRSAPKLYSIEEFEEEEEEEEEIEKEEEMTRPEESQEIHQIPQPTFQNMEIQVSPQIARKSDRRSNPIDSKLNLPYLTGYDKVMHLLDMPQERGEMSLEEYPYVATNSDPVASTSSNSAVGDEEGDVSDEGSDDFVCLVGKKDSEEMPDNLSDESGYSEERRPNILIKPKTNSTQMKGIGNSSAPCLILYDNLCFEI